MDEARIKAFLAPRNTGYGYGDGSGYGDGYGDGSGYGSGDGYGDGSGYGSGYGGLKAYGGKPVYYIDATPTILTAVRHNYAKGYIIKEDFTLSPCFVARVDDCYAHGATLRDATRDAMTKAMQSMSLEERLAKFKEAFPSLEDKATCREFHEWHHTLTGSCTMGRDEFVKAHGLDMDATYTVGYFLHITSDSYGKDVIGKLKKSYN